MAGFLWQPHLIIVIAASILYDWFLMSTASKIVIAASIKKISFCDVFLALTPQFTGSEENVGEAAQTLP